MMVSGGVLMISPFMSWQGHKLQRLLNKNNSSPLEQGSASSWQAPYHDFNSQHKYLLDFCTLIGVQLLALSFVFVFVLSLPFLLFWTFCGWKLRDFSSCSHTWEALVPNLNLILVIISWALINSIKNISSLLLSIIKLYEVIKMFQCFIRKEKLW